MLNMLRQIALDQGETGKSYPQGRIPRSAILFVSCSNRETPEKIENRDENSWM